MLFLIFRIGAAGHHSYFKHGSQEYAVAVRFVLLFYMIPLFPISAPVLIVNPQPCARRYKFHSAKKDCSCFDFAIAYLFAWLRLFTLGIICCVKCPASEERKKQLVGQYGLAKLGLLGAGAGAGGGAGGADDLTQALVKNKASQEGCKNTPAVQTLVNKLHNPPIPADCPVMKDIAIKVGKTTVVKLFEGAKADDDLSTREGADTTSAASSRKMGETLKTGLEMMIWCVELNEENPINWINLGGMLTGSESCVVGAGKQRLSRSDILTLAIHKGQDNATVWNDVGAKLAATQTIFLQISAEHQANHIECFRQALSLRPTYDMALRNLAIFLPASACAVLPNYPHPLTKQTLLCWALHSYPNDAKILALLGNSLQDPRQPLQIHTGQFMTARDFYWASCQVDPSKLLKVALIGMQRVMTPTDRFVLPNNVIISQQTIAALIKKGVASHAYKAPTNPMAKRAPMQAPEIPPPPQAADGSANQPPPPPPQRESEEQQQQPVSNNSVNDYIQFLAQKQQEDQQQQQQQRADDNAAVADRSLNNNDDDDDDDAELATQPPMDESSNNIAAEDVPNENGAEDAETGGNDSHHQQQEQQGHEDLEDDDGGAGPPNASVATEVPPQVEQQAEGLPPAEGERNDEDGGDVV